MYFGSLLFIYKLEVEAQYIFDSDAQFANCFSVIGC